MSSSNFNQKLKADLYKAYLDARKHKTATANEFKFEANFPENLAGLYRDIVNRTYRPSRGIAFVTKNPVIREIFAAPFRDRVVHHLIINYVEQWWDRRFIYDSYSCRKNKGTDCGVRRLVTMIRRVSQNHHIPTVVLKYDIQGYFTSLPRDGLYRRAIWGLKRQFLHPGHTKDDLRKYRLLKFLWAQIIFDDPVNNVVVKGSRKIWGKLPKRKSLFYQPAGRGIVIGNLTSQVASNIYLDQLDQFVTKTLGYKNYGRYVDDFFIVLPASEVADFKRRIEPLIEDFIIGLGLALHPHKRRCIPVEQGVPFLGVRVYPYHITPDKRILAHYRRDIRLVMGGIKDPEVLTSYMGRLQHLDAQGVQEHIWAEVGLEYKKDPHGGPNSRYFVHPRDYEKHRPTRRRKSS